MKDRTGVKLKVGDIVETGAWRNVDNFVSKTAIIAEIEPNSVIILFDNNGMPRNSRAQAENLLKLGKHFVPKSTRQSLKNVKEIFEQMTQDARVI